MKLAEIINIIQGLIDKINARTGKEDTTLTEAVNRLTSGSMVDTSDANAADSDMAKNKIAYVKGKKVTGNLSIYGNASFPYKKIEDYPSSKCIYAIGQNSERRIISQTGTVQVKVPYEELGNATEDDVVSGKIFTSSAGFKKSGTAEMFKKKTGAIEIAGDTGSFTIDTGLSNIDMIIVKKDNPGNNETYFWAGKSTLTHICATGVNYISIVTPLERTGGKATCKRYSTQYPIKAGTFKWVAYGI